MTDSEQIVSPSEPISVSEVLELLAHGEMTLQGLVPWSSNYTFLVVVRAHNLQALAIYKPSRGERPLWDFPSQSLCRREVATYILSQHLGWPEIPPVVLRKGTHGLGSVQLFVEADLEAHYFTMRDKPEYEEAFRRIALFDYAVNNADRKGGHVLQGAAGKVWAIDHGLTFHTEYKLRTVIWDYAGQDIPAGWLDDLRSLRDMIEGASPLHQALSRLISAAEIAALKQRLNDLLRHKTFPRPRKSWRNVPYPLI